MRQGYTLIWWGWEMDVRPGLKRILMPPVVAHLPDGSAVTGVVRSELLTNAPTTTLPLSRSQQVLVPPPDSYDGYPAARLDNQTPTAQGFLPTLTVRAREQDQRVRVPNSDWSFGICGAAGAPATLDAKHVCMRSGFKPGRLYELIYQAKDPTALGIGFAATRDLGVFLTHQRADSAGTANPIFAPGQRAIIEGSSQSGRMIHSFLALGFNEDESGRRVFDGVSAYRWRAHAVEHPLRSALSRLGRAD